MNGSGARRKVSFLFGQQERPFHAFLFGQQERPFNESRFARSSWQTHFTEKNKGWLHDRCQTKLK